ncbi:tetratricopeptide repeat protein [uncultured Alistipes sp.]|uniref:tetratricopeptide repeat protein n=1 Tax=uncultured Alistipes sp. TaxID=538949 RepID=UPI002583F9C6|nr:tetratricopeptide repeat protein [uncultured Alistipes sp.]
MQKSLYTLLFLLTATAAGAQQMPERSLVRKGNRQYAKGNYEESIRRYEQALEAVPGQFEATYDLGNALYKAERFDRAEQTLRQAAADTLRPETELAEAYYNLGNAQFKQQKYKEALESYKQSLRLNPSDMEAKYNYAYTKRLLDQDQNGGGGNDQQNQDQNQDQNQNQDRNQQGQQNPQQGQGRQDPQQGQQDRKDPGQDGNPQQQPPQSDKGEQDDAQGSPQQAPGISPQEQEQILDAIQAQEDKTQEKLKEKRGVVVRGRKNW